MSDETSDRDEVFDFLAEERRNRRDPEEHPSPETLTAYQANELSPEEDERLQEHLARCRHCTEMLLELEEFLQPEEPAAAVALEPEDLQQMPGLLPATTDKAYRSSFALPLVASLIGALILLGYSFWQTIHLKREVTVLQHQVAELREPVASPPTFSLRSTRGESALEIAADPVVGLAFDAPEPGKYSDYRAHILDEDGNVLWNGSLSKDRDGRLTFLLVRGYLKPGKYTIRLIGVDHGSLDLLQENRIRVLSGSPENPKR